MMMMMTGLRSGQFGFDIDDDVMSLHASTEKPCSLGLLGQRYCQLINTGTHTHARTHIHRAEDRKVKKKGKECVKLTKCCVFEGINSVPAGQHSRDDQAEHLQGHDGTGIRRRRQVG